MTQGDVTIVPHRVARADRSVRNGHDGAVLWLTGLSGAGKSTIAMGAELRLFEAGYQCYVLDGDNIRSGLNADLGFSPEDRSQNVRRTAHVAGLFADAGFVALVSLISPYRADRAAARASVTRLGVPFFEVYVSTDLETCMQRDTKGFYRRARQGDLASFTGVSAPYEPPLDPELVIDAGRGSAENSAELVRAFVASRMPRRS